MKKPSQALICAIFWEGVEKSRRKNLENGEKVLILQSKLAQHICCCKELGY